MVCFIDNIKRNFFSCYNSDIKISFFSEKNSYVLFSGTSIGGNGPFRHLNDLFLVLYVLIKKNIPKEKIYLVIDQSILANLDNRTNNKKFLYLDNGCLTFNEIFRKYIDSKNIIDVLDFEKKFTRKESEDLIFFASGHGSINGLAIDNKFEPRGYKNLSSDYFENIASSKNRTYLIMSQCIAAAFHHLDTRKNICVQGASDYQSSVSLDIKSMLPSEAIPTFEPFIFEEGIALNPFMFSMFLALYSTSNVILNDKKNIINIFKYVAASTLDYLSKSGKRSVIISKSLLSQMQGDTLKIDFEERILVQQPFLLNKIIAARTYVEI